MKFDQVLYEKKESVAVVTLDQPDKLNSLSAGMRRGLLASLDEADRDDEVTGVIVTGAGRAFCAGADIAGFGSSVPATRRLLKEFFDLFHTVETFRKLLIAAVNGLALGGGFELALTADIILASEKAEFGTPEPKLGLMPGFAVLRLPQVVGRYKAKEIAMTADNISAQEALRLNLVSRVVPAEQLTDQAVLLARRIARNGPLAVQMIKASVNRELGGQDLAYGVESSALLAATEDARNGLAAFLKKEKPVFRGR